MLVFAAEVPFKDTLFSCSVVYELLFLVKRNTYFWLSQISILYPSVAASLIIKSNLFDHHSFHFVKKNYLQVACLYSYLKSGVMHNCNIMETLTASARFFIWSIGAILLVVTPPWHRHTTSSLAAELRRCAGATFCVQ